MAAQDRDSRPGEIRFGSSRNVSGGVPDRGASGTVFERHNYAGGYGGGLAEWGGGPASTGRYTGRGPKNYRRSDARICEDVCERLTHDPDIDATDIEVTVADSEVTLTGFVASREEKRNAEDAAYDVWAVRDVRNQLRVKPIVGEERDFKSPLPLNVPNR